MAIAERQIMRLATIELTVRRLYEVLDSLGGTKSLPADRYFNPEPGEEGSDVWFDLKAGEIRIGKTGDFASFELEQYKQAEDYILENYGETEVPF